MDTSRRDFMKWMGAVSLGFVGLRSIAGSNDLFAMAAEDLSAFGYGPLKALDSILKLPAGFSYKIIGKKGDKMSDGLFLPGRPDGMGAFTGSKGKVILIRNHEKVR